MIALAVALLALSGQMVTPLRARQVEYDLTNEPVKGVNPGIALATTALGAFRGLIVDVIWIRMEELVRQGKFFEIVQLADLACKLAPRFPEVWDFNAWNMAYNVSVQIPQLQERWAWVRKGIELLRQEGIPNNPTVPELYFTLGFIYMHKVGGEIDESHFWYKQNLGLEMHEVLGGSGSRTELERFAKAPKTRRELLLDPEVKALYEQCVAQGFDPLREEAGGSSLAFLAWVRRPDSVPEGASKVLEAPHNKDALSRLADFARARRLEDMHLEPEKMIALGDEFGPFDWRSPYPHAMYWAKRGLEVTQRYRARLAEQRKRFGLKELDDAYWSRERPASYHDVRYDRVIYGALQNLVSRGRLLYDSRGNILPMMGPDYRFTEAMIRYFQHVNALYGEHELYFGGVRAAYENFLIRAIVEFVYMGDEANARRYHQILQRDFPGEKNLVSFEQFVTTQLTGYVSRLGPDECRSLLRGLLQQSYFYAGAGADDRAEPLYRRAEAILRQWEAEFKQETFRTRIDFAKTKESVLLDIFAGRAGFPEEVVSGLKSRLRPEDAKILEEAARRQKQAQPATPMEVEEKFKIFDQ